MNGCPPVMDTFMKYKAFARCHGVSGRPTTTVLNRNIEKYLGHERGTKLCKINTFWLFKLIGSRRGKKGLVGIMVMVHKGLSGYQYGSSIMFRFDGGGKGIVFRNAKPDYSGCQHCSCKGKLWVRVQAA